MIELQNLAKKTAYRIRVTAINLQVLKTDGQFALPLPCTIHFNFITVSPQENKLSYHQFLFHQQYVILCSSSNKTHTHTHTHTTDLSKRNTLRGETEINTTFVRLTPAASNIFWGVWFPIGDFIAFRLICFGTQTNKFT